MIPKFKIELSVMEILKEEGFSISLYIILMRT